jgi:DUF1680 family protein
VNGEAIDASDRRRGYCVIRRDWQAGDCVTIALPMPVQSIRANDKVEADLGRIALMRGPLVYCLESVDHEGDLDDIALSVGAEWETEFAPDLIGGVTVLRDEERAISAIPYYAWNNRTPGKMRVWVPERENSVW